MNRGYFGASENGVYRASDVTGYFKTIESESIEEVKVKKNYIFVKKVFWNPPPFFKKRE